MKRIDWGTVIVWVCLILIVIISIVVIAAQIYSDIAILASKDMPFWLKWKLLQGLK